MQTRRCDKHTMTLAERLALEALQLREIIRLMPAGAERDALARKARELDVGAHMDQWLNSPGLQPPV
jgi:hypothetical protein